MSGFAKAILLKYTGDITTIKCNKKINVESPLLKHFMGIKNKGEGDIGQIGSWEDIDMDGNIFYIYGWQKGTLNKKNAIMLPHPYDDIELYNDIVVIKTDINNTICNLTEGEYETFYKEISGIIESDSDFSDGEDLDIINDVDDTEEKDDEIENNSDTDDSDDDDIYTEPVLISKETDELCLTDEEL